MLIRFLKRWRGQAAGKETEFADGAANVLIRRGIAEQVKHKPRRKRDRDDGAS